MTRSTWIVIGAIALIGLIVGWQSLPAQPGPFPGMPGMGQVGRYVVVRADKDSIVIMDTTTGDLFRAKDDDIKEYNARPKNQPLNPRDIRLPRPEDKEKRDR